MKIALAEAFLKLSVRPPVVVGQGLSSPPFTFFQNI